MHKYNRSGVKTVVAFKVFRTHKLHSFQCNGLIQHGPLVGRAQIQMLRTHNPLVARTHTHRFQTDRQPRVREDLLW